MSEPEMGAGGCSYLDGAILVLGKDQFSDLVPVFQLGIQEALRQ